MIQPSPCSLPRRCSSHTIIWVLVAVLLGPSWEACAGSIEVWYGPEDRPLEQLVRLYDRAKQSIFIAAYGFTSPLSVKALIEAKRRGVDVRILTDRERLNDPKQRTALSALREAGVPIRINQHESLMHLKQVVVDDDINANGSMNQTTSGNQYNDERLDIIRDHTVTVKARDKFLSMWKDHERFQEWK